MRRFSRGEYVTLDTPGLTGHVSGTVRSSNNVGDSTYVRLYSYAFREERFYHIDRDGIARPADARDEAAWSDLSTEDAGSPRPRGEPGGALWLLGAVLLLALLLSTLSGGLARVRAARMSYKEFLETEMSLEELVDTVRARVSYEHDVEDFWSPAPGVWETRRGDCEDYAMLISAYLDRWGVEHQVVGFSLTDSLAGHAAVIARTEDARVLLDPTTATADAGIEYAHRGPSGELPSPAEVLEDYAVLPAAEYDTPPEPGKPAVSGYVER
ncbi:MAG: transglutaminase-like domain-containing protein [Spirochaetaceae bacterium]